MDQLKQHYKMLALQLHPDKCGGRISPEEASAAFQVLTNAYRYIANDIRQRQSSLQHSELKKAFEDSNTNGEGIRRDARTRDGCGSEKLKFDLSRFNEVFSKDRLVDPIFDTGYGQWMQTTDPVMCNEDVTNTRQLIVHSTPEPVVVVNRGKGNIQYSELGVDALDDYSRCDALASGGIQYTDYKVAHTTTKLVDPDACKNKQVFNTIDQLNQHRSTLSFTMNDEEIEEYSTRLELDAKRENDRLENLRKRERLIAEHHQRINGLMLNYRS